MKLDHSVARHKDPQQIIQLVQNLEKQNMRIEEGNKELNEIITELKNYKIIMEDAIREKLKEGEKPEHIKALLKRR